MLSITRERVDQLLRAGLVGAERQCLANVGRGSRCASTHHVTRERACRRRRAGRQEGDRTTNQRRCKAYLLASTYPGTIPNGYESEPSVVPHGPHGAQSRVACWIALHW